MVAKRVLITGTTSGIGLALLAHYDSAGVAVIAVNRRRVAELELRYPRVRFECVDVTFAENVSGLVRSLSESGALPDVFILNAGINRKDNDEFFELSSYREVVETNLYGALNFIQPLTQLSSDGTERHVVAISSMAVYGGNPYGLGYTTSKQALSTSFDVLSKMYAGTDLVFQQVLMGPVGTAIYTMESQLPRWMARVKNAFSASPEGTAHAIAGFALTRKGKLIYPRAALPLFIAMGLGQRFIPGFYQGRRTLNGKARRVA